MGAETMNEEMQQAFYLSQMQKKRALKEQCLRGPQSQGTLPEEASALTGTVMANLMAFAIREGRDVFAMLEELRKTPTGQNMLDSVLSWLQRLADGLDVGAYELFIDDGPRRRKIVYKLLRRLEEAGFDGWEDIHVEASGDAGFAMADFDVWAMGTAAGHGVALVFRRQQLENSRRYELLVGSTNRRGPDGLMPDHALLWEESAGALGDFVEQTLSDLEGGWLLLKQRFGSRRQQLERERQTLEDLLAVLEEQPQGLKPGPLLQKEARLLEQLREETQQDYSRMPQTLKESPRGQAVREQLLLLGGAVQGLRRAPSEPDKVPEALSEALFLLEGTLDIHL